MTTTYQFNPFTGNFDLVTTAIDVAPSKVLYVDPNNPTTLTRTGSVLQPFTTIGDAVAQIISNADNVTYKYQILIAPGVYSETITLNSTTLYNVTFSSMSAVTGAGGDSAEIVDLTGDIVSTSNNDQLKNFEFNGITIRGAITLTGASASTQFGQQGITFANCTIYLASTAMVITNAGDILFQLCEIRTGSGTGVMTFSNVNFFMFNYTGVSAGTMSLVTNGGNSPVGFAGTFGIVNYAGMISNTTVDAGSELDYRYSRIGSSSAKTVTNNGLIRSFQSVWTSTATLNNGSTTVSIGDIWVTNPTVNSGASLTWPGTTNNATTKSANLVLRGSTSGLFTLNANATTTDYTLKMPAAQGAADTTLLNDGSGNLSFGKVSLTANVSGVLPIANGGTNISTYTTGDTLYASASNVLSKRAIGSTGDVLTVAGGVPTWAAPTGFANPMNAVGDLIRGGASGAPTRLAIGSTNQMLAVVGGIPTWISGTGLGTAPGVSQVTVNIPNGHGSTNTAIRTFSNVLTNTGPDITYASSATLGDTFTINTTGIYSITYQDGGSVLGAFYGMSVNASTLSTSIDAIAAANFITDMATIVNNEAYAVPISITKQFTAGDVIRAHTDANNNVNGTDKRLQFNIIRLA